MMATDDKIEKSLISEGAPSKVPASIVILNVYPEVDCGRFPAKRILGDKLEIMADIVKPGHDILAANLVWRMKGNENWKSQQMAYSYDEDSWSSEVVLSQLGFFEFFIEAWSDRFSKKIRDLVRWKASGEDISAQIEELLDLVKMAANIASQTEKVLIEREISSLGIMTSPIATEDADRLVGLLSEKLLSSIVIKNQEKIDYTSSKVFTVIVDRPVARYSAWYELFHRSQGNVPSKSATFKDCEKRLQEIRNMGFDVIYLPPIHPIGLTNRRGPNNTKSQSSQDPGSPWAIGNEIGGHDSVNPELGTIGDFLDLISRIRELKMEVALDLAFQVSPDHRYVSEHPEWLFHGKDGTIRFAENPPKRYYDIYPLNFENPNWMGLWEELRRVVEFWVEKGVKTFRVDNPHTKPISFWEWLISSVRQDHPDVVFLSEAFTRPEPMKLLAKAGFDQSYTYFTWKNSKYELTEFIKEFLLSEVQEYYRPNLFTNTPDILPEYLQTGGRAAFKIREVLAATLSSSYGIYNGFELCENRPRSKGSEEYLDSEKYQYKVWDWDRAGNIKEYITKLNKIRSENPALQENSNLRLLQCDVEHIIFYGKWSKDLSNIILVAVNLDPFSSHEATVTVPTGDLSLGRNYVVKDLVTERTFTWSGERNYVKLDPNIEPAHVLKVIR